MAAIRSPGVTFKIRGTNCIDLLLAGALFTFGLYVLACRPRWIGDDLGAAAGLAGALFGGAALLLGNWINRFNDRLKAAQEQAAEVGKLKIAAELVDVACGLMSAKQLVDAAIVVLQAGGPVSETLDMSAYRPRQMPFTDSLGTKLLALEQRAARTLLVRQHH
jgi:hypothetical protein